jgi:DNA-binding NarL/FixJ family response regulator
VTRARVLIADDHAVVRRGLRMLLADEADFEVVAEAGDGVEALDRATREDIDLAVLDVAMPKMTGLQVARELHRRKPHVRLLMLSMYDNSQYLAEASRAGATGYVLKSMADRELVRACRSVMDGTSAFPGGRRVAGKGNGREGGPPAPELTPREREVLKLVAEGHSSLEIAELLFISIKTVERHRTHLLKKLGMRDRVDLTRYAIREGLVEP